MTQSDSTGTPCTRRDFIQKGALSCVALELSDEAAAADNVRISPYASISARAQAVLDKVDWRSFSGMQHIRGFNYQPSWGHDAASIWLENFDSRRYREELETGKKYFPAFNCVRIWLGYGAYQEDPAQLVKNFNEALKICTKLELLIVPVLFTVWGGDPPFDPIAIKSLVGLDFERAFGSYLRDIVTPHRGNKSILAWDLCNEPMEGNVLDPVNQAEACWLKFTHDRVKSIDREARTCIGTIPEFGWGQSVAEYCDVLTPHLYGYSLWKPVFDRGETRVEFQPWFESAVQQYVVRTRFLNQKPKPILASETCWGSRDDLERKRIIQATLATLQRYRIGFLPHALYASGVADLHVPENYQPILMECIANPASMNFINADGTLRRGHEVYNDYNASETTT